MQLNYHASVENSMHKRTNEDALLSFRVGLCQRMYAMCHACLPGMLARVAPCTHELNSECPTLNHNAAIILRKRHAYTPILRRAQDMNPTQCLF
jgi:hypothetical protein